MEEPFTQRLTITVNSHLADEHFGVSELASELGISRTTLHRKIKNIFNKSVSTYIREIRLRRAFEMLQNKEGTVAEIAYNVGFGSATYFNKCFHDYYGYPPGDIQKGKPHFPEITEENNPVKRKLKFRISGKLVLLIVLPILILFVFYSIQTNETFNKNRPKTIVIPTFTALNGTNTCNYTILFRELLNKKIAHLENIDVINGSMDHIPKKVKLNTIKELGKFYNADFVLTGVEITIENKISILLVLTNTKKYKRIWSNEYAVDTLNLNNQVTDIAFTITQEIEMELSQTEQDRIKNNLSDNPITTN